MPGGQLRKVALVGALLAQPQMLILDEPTNHLDMAVRAPVHLPLGWHKTCNLASAQSCSYSGLESKCAAATV